MRRSLRVFSKVYLTFEIAEATIGDPVPGTGIIDDLDKVRIFELWESSLYRGVRDIVSFLLEIYLKPFLVEGDSRVCQVLQNDIVSTSHPWSPVSTNHTLSPQRYRIIPSETLTVGPYLSILDQYMGQPIYVMTKIVVTTADAALLGVVDSRKTGSTPVSSARASCRSSR